mgnify:CR=1 FL=1
MIKAPYYYGIAHISCFTTQSHSNEILGWGTGQTVSCAENSEAPFFLVLILQTVLPKSNI